MDPRAQRKVDMVVHVYNPSTWETKEEDLKFKVILGYILRPCLNKKPLGDHFIHFLI
jgi:hypothetical protein